VSQAAIGSTLHHMGIVREKQGRLDAAMELYRSALNLWKAAQGSELLAKKLLHPLESAGHLHAEVATALGSMGSVCEKQGKLDEAMAHYEQALEIQESVLGGEHAAAARTRRGMGIVRQRQGRLDEAMAFFERALAIEEVALGTGHVELTSTLMNMGLVRRDQGRLEEALELYARTLRIREASLGSSHRLTAITLVAMGRVWQLQGRLDEAMAQYERALPIFSSPQVKEHSMLGWVYRSMGSVREEQSRLNEAMTLLEHALAIEQAALGGRHPFVGKTLMCMGSVLEKQGRAREAIVYLRRAQEIFTQPSLGLRPSPSQTGLGHAHPLARQVTTSLFRLGAEDEEDPQSRHDPHSRGEGRVRFWCGAALLVAAAAVGVTIALRRAGSARAPALPHVLPLVPALVLPLWPPLDIAFAVPQNRNVRRG
jgi:tetratricopeptide (TPR) repeat protein